MNTNPPTEQNPQLTQEAVDDSTADSIFMNFNSESGLLFTSDGILPPEQPDDETSDEDILEWAVGFYRVDKGHLSDPDYRAAVIAEARPKWNQRFVGGAGGVTQRSMKDLETELPTVRDALATERGKVVVLGAGFSELPILLAGLYRHHRLSTPAVINDLFDYGAAQRDLGELKRRFLAANLDFPYELELQRATEIVKQIEYGNLQTAEYMVGSGDPPDNMRQAQLVINIHGPTASRNEQLSLLAPHGRLLSTGGGDQAPEGFAATNIGGGIQISRE